MSNSILFMYIKVWNGIQWLPKGCIKLTCKAFKRALDKGRTNNTCKKISFYFLHCVCCYFSAQTSNMELQRHNTSPVVVGVWLCVWGSQLNVQLIADNPGGPAAVNWKIIAYNHCIEIMESVQGFDSKKSHLAECYAYYGRTFNLSPLSCIR